ncbi:type II secretion system protein [Crassaminicella profunda]|uniref:type II secretion system protein n=1 Tax=Crassaminicella profunda TaxID=1286698 RepID=UPI001CA67A11|nr:type II secretion system protein [Crassaminicella profunda]QZY56986.1 type II secretion system GspH family protein [Crassaminicella profunda]
MLKIFSKRMKNKKGFTLIELIVVIAILGILAGIVVPKFGGFTEKAKVEADKTACKTIQTAVLVALTNEDISGTGTITINNTGDTKFEKSDAITVKSDTTLKAVMENLLGSDVKAQAKNKTKFEATIDAKGDVTVVTAE